MTALRKICVVTGSRAEYGLLQRVIHDLHKDPAVELQLVVTGMHLSPEFGLTVRVIEQDGFPISDRVEMLLSSDTPVGIGKSVGMGVMAFSETFVRRTPDWVLLLGDRFEILAAAQGALFTQRPIAHLCGGDSTEGSLDEACRHAITKMAHLHFVSNAQAQRRVLQMGEDPARVFNVGSPGLDTLRQQQLLDRKTLEVALDCPLRARNLLITFHPDTLAPGSSVAEFQQLLDALDAIGPDVGLFFTLPNADAGGRGLIRMVEVYTAARPNARAYASLGQQRYLSLAALADAVVGNSSSGFYEVPSLKRPTVNIGDRQKGRLAADSVLSVAPQKVAIEQAIHKAFTLDCSRTVNPYGDGHAAERIVRELKAVQNPQTLLKKHFHLLGA
ncbi:MAG: UDP-N-acetylglucosamine 2-epimerase [Pseudomonadota bacterium]